MQKRKTIPHRDQLAVKWYKRHLLSLSLTNRVVLRDSGSTPLLGTWVRRTFCRLALVSHRAQVLSDFPGKDVNLKVRLPAIRIDP